MEQTYTITQDGNARYHFHGKTVADDGGSWSREYADGTDLETVRATGLAEMKGEALRLQSTVVESGTLDEAHAKVQASTTAQAVALAKLSTADKIALGLHTEPPRLEDL